MSKLPEMGDPTQEEAAQNRIRIEKMNTQTGRRNRNFKFTAKNEGLDSGPTHNEHLIAPFKVRVTIEE